MARCVTSTPIWLARAAVGFAFGAAPSGGCTREATPSGGSSRSTSSAAPERIWLRYLQATASTSDSRGGGEVASCWAAESRTVGPCPSSDAHLRPPPLRDASIEHIRGLLACSADTLVDKPRQYERVTLGFVLRASGEVTTTVPAQALLASVAFARCVERAARGIEQAEAGAAAGEITVQLTFWYDHWCEDVAPVGDARPIVRVRDVKEVPRWNLVPQADGYVLALCDSPNTWRLAIDGARLSVADAGGAVAGAIEPTADGFALSDAAGHVLRRGRYDAGGVALEDGAGRAVGRLSSSAEAPDGGGASEVAALERQVGGRVGVTRRGGRYAVDWWSVEPDTIPPRAAAVLADAELSAPWQPALVAYFAAGLDTPRR